MITSERGVLEVCQVLEVHRDTAEVIDMACSLIWSLSVEGDHLYALSCTPIYTYVVVVCN